MNNYEDIIKLIPANANVTLGNCKVTIGTKTYGFKSLKDLSLFPVYYDFLEKCNKAKYSEKSITDCSWLFIKYLNAFGLNIENKDIREEWYSFDYDFHIDSIEHYYRYREVLPVVDCRSNLRSKHFNKYKVESLKKYIKKYVNEKYSINQNISYDFFIYLLETKDYEPASLKAKIRYINMWNDFFKKDFCYINQTAVVEYSVLQRRKGKQQRAGIVWALGELVEYLYKKNIIKNRIVVTTKISKYPPVYIYEYADEKDEIRASHDRKTKYIWFNKLNNELCLPMIRDYSIFMLNDTKKPYVSIQSIINLLCVLANSAEKSFENITKEEFVEYFNKHHSRLANTTKNTYYINYYEFFEWLRQNNYVKTNIVDKRYEKADYVDKNVSYSAYEMQVLFANMNKLPDDMYRLALILLAATGMRMSEIIDIRRSMVKKIEQFYLIMVESDKAEKYQSSYISKAIYDYINDYMHKYPSNTDYLFVNNNSQKITAGSVSTVLRNFPKENNLKNESGEIIKINPHKFRHNIAVTLQNAGTPITIVQRVLNHNNLETTKHYLDNAVESVRKRRMNNLGINEISNDNIPTIRDTYDNLINSDSVTQILISGACKKMAFSAEGKKCGNNPNECYKCNLFLPDESKLDEYKSQLKEMLFIRDKYIQNENEIEAYEIEKNIYALSEVIERMESYYLNEKSNNIRQLSI